MSFIIDIRDPNKISTDLFHVWGILDYLVKEEDYKMENINDISNEDRINLSDYFDKKYNTTLKNIIIFAHLKNLHLDFQKPENTDIIWYGDDIHVPDYKRSFPLIDRFVLSYGYAMHLHHSCVKDNIYYFPHSFYFDIEFNKSPIQKVLVSGRERKKFYPKRQIGIYIARKNNSTLANYLDVNFGYQIDNEDSNLIYGEKYIKELNKYLICFACDSCKLTPYILAKVFEILSSGALLMYAIEDRNKPYLDKLGLVDGVHYISCSKYRLSEQMTKYLGMNERENINRIRKNGYDFVRKYHNYKNRAEAFHKIVEKNENFTTYTDGINGTSYKLAIDPISDN